MPPKKKEIDEHIKKWMTEIKFGLDYRKRYSTKDRWTIFRKYYRGQWAQGIIPINKIFSYGRMLMPRVYFRAPRVVVTPSRPELIWHAKVVEALDNLLIKEVILKQTLKMSSLDSYLCGVGPIKLGYDSEYGYLPSQAVAGSGETVTQHSTTEESEKIEYNQMIKPGMPWAIRVRPEDIVVPFGCTDPSSLPWIAHYILRPLDDIKQDQKYDKAKTKELQGTRSPTMGEDTRTREAFRPRSEREKGIIYGELWEIRDFKTKQIMVFSEDQMILSDEDVLQTEEGIPWEFIIFNPDPEYFWAIPDAHILSPQQEELNEINSQESRHRKIALLKFLYLQGKLEKEELEKFLSGEVGIAVAVKAEVENIQSVVSMLQPHVPPDFAVARNAQMQAMREELGFSQNQEGAFSPYHGKTATETMTVAESFEERVDERRDIVADVLVNIVRKWNRMLFEFWTEEKVLQIITPEGEPAWIQYTGDQLKGDYMLSVDAESGMPINRSLKLQMGDKLMEMFNGDQLIDQITLRQIVTDNYGIIDPRVPKLLQAQYAGRPEDVSKERQPEPIAVGGGKGSGGGQKPSSPQQPIPFEKFRKNMEAAK